MGAFWRRGYEATSVADLMEATGLAKGSIYKGFGDKRALFLRALEVYLDAWLERMRAPFDAPGCLAALRGWLAQGVELATAETHGERQGCFAINCAVELGPHDPEVRERVRARFGRIERLVERTLARGIEQGELRADLDPKVAARSLVTLMGGLQVAGKLGASRKDAMASVELTLRGLT